EGSAPGHKAINPFRQLCAIGGTTPMKNDSDGRAKVPSEPHRIGRLVIFAEFERALIAEHAGQDSPPRAPARARSSAWRSIHRSETEVSPARGRTRAPDFQGGGADCGGIRSRTGVWCRGTA